MTTIGSVLYGTSEEDEHHRLHDDNAKFPETMANETYQDLLKQLKAVVETYGLKDNGWRR